MYIKNIFNILLMIERHATFGTAIALLSIPMFNYNEIWSVALLFAMMLCYGMVAGGDIPLAAEMSDKYPATIFAFGNMLASTTGFITPSIVGCILGDSNQDIRRWSIIFESTAAVSAFGGFVFLVFASAERIEFD
ncbi:putative sialin-like protein [Leptotrombidium deliense]|uniref:Putative sialin-like protein n=1 Tax=Leptotrombidium deliense TaxID=299467 RepID=A0A443SCH8_9ACAR|nr:putative sialin-like protein [Leptotrombidium deliense]